MTPAGRSTRPAAKKAAKKSVRRAVRGVAVGAATFSTTQTPETLNVVKDSVALFVNGQSKGVVDTKGQKLGDFVVAHAQDAGIRSFSVYVDGVKADTADGEKKMTGITKVEIVAKDARG